MDDCEYYDECLNNDKCFRCYNHQLLKSKKKKMMSNISSLIPRNDNKELTKDNSWEDLEQTVVNKLNDVPTIQEARRSRASGALWFERGDVVDSILHPECKERTAEKSFSIKREWLEKAVNECKYSDKFMCLPFRFKGDDQVYTVMRNEDIMELVTLMKAYIADNERMRKIIYEHEHMD